MQLMRNLGVRKGKIGRRQSWGLFFCEKCKNYVKKQLGAGRKAKSCGCTQYKENKRKYKHVEGYGTRLYNIWALIKQRIFNPKASCYKNYGGKGIKICNEWLAFIPFRDWALSNGYQENLQINRIEINGNYEPNNCNFVTQKENMRYRTTAKLILGQVNEIRALYNSGYYTQQRLSEIYSVSNSLISQIITNKIWKN